MIERSPRAPVLRSIARLAMAAKASSGECQDSRLPTQTSVDIA